jgi:uncharacterized protein (UPF0332 family)
MKASDLIVSGHKLLLGQPTEADCKRAISSAYYALFYFLCEMSSKSLVGAEDTSFSRARYQVFRSLKHGLVFDRCKECKNEGMSFPKEVQEFADTFIELQEQREFADYCCDRKYSSASATDYLNQAEAAIQKLEKVDIDHQRAFSLFILLAPNPHSKKMKVSSKSSSSSDKKKIQK